MNWLEGKSVRIVGQHAVIEAALVKQGATIVADGPADCLVHIAGVSAAKPAHEMSHAEWRSSMDAGLDSQFHAANAFATECRDRSSSGSILFVSEPEQSLGTDHAAAAGALGNLTKTLGVEWARDGVRVNAILTKVSGDAPGALAAYFLSDYGAYITGAVTGVDNCDY